MWLVSGLQRQAGIAPPEQLAIMAPSLTPCGENLCLPVLIAGIPPTHVPAAALVTSQCGNITSARTLNAAQRLPPLTLTRGLFLNEGVRILPGARCRRKQLRQAKQKAGGHSNPAPTPRRSLNPRQQISCHPLALRCPVWCCCVSVLQSHANHLNQAGGITDSTRC